MSAYKVKIETLTPVHIGSGKRLNEGLDFDKFESENGSKHVKVYKFDEMATGLENIGQYEPWLRSVERYDNNQQNSYPKHFKSFLQKQQNIEGFIARVIPFSKRNEEESLILPVKKVKEHIHTSLLGPMLPGTSLKGAIRTAIFYDKISALSPDTINRTLKRPDGTINTKDIQFISDIFGKDTTYNTMRFLKITDCFFNKTNLYHSKMINMHGNNFIKVEKNSEFIEAIPSLLSSEVMINIENDHYNLNKEKFPDKFKAFEIKNIHQLFRVINKYAYSRIVKEFNLLKLIGDAADKRIFQKNLVELINIIGKEELESANPKTALIRLGFGISHTFMTGGWMVDKFNVGDPLYDSIALKARFGRKGYEHYPLPKQRRYVGDGIPLGWVKLTLIE